MLVTEHVKALVYIFWLLYKIIVDSEKNIQTVQTHTVVPHWLLGGSTLCWEQMTSVENKIRQSHFEGAIHILSTS